MASSSQHPDTAKGKQQTEIMVADSLGNFLEEDNDSITFIPKVPEFLRRGANGAYDPQIMSIGPYHWGKPQFEDMEKLKRRLLREFLDRKLQCPLNDYIREVESMEAQLRRCYHKDVCEISSNFVQMMLVDGCFLVEFFLQVQEGKWRANGDEGKDYRLKQLTSDIVKLENQLPFFFLERIFNMYKAKATAELEHPFVIYALLFSCVSIERNLDGLSETTLNGYLPERIHHFLHLHHAFLVSQFFQEGPTFVTPSESSSPEAPSHPSEGPTSETPSEPSSSTMGRMWTRLFNRVTFNAFTSPEAPSNPSEGPTSETPSEPSSSTMARTWAHLFHRVTFNAFTSIEAQSRPLEGPTLEAPSEPSSHQVTFNAFPTPESQSEPSGGPTSKTPSEPSSSTMGSVRRKVTFNAFTSPKAPSKPSEGPTLEAPSEPSSHQVTFNAIATLGAPSEPSEGPTMGTPPEPSEGPTVPTTGTPPEPLVGPTMGTPPEPSEGPTVPTMGTPPEPPSSTMGSMWMSLFHHITFNAFKSPEAPSKPLKFPSATKLEELGVKFKGFGREVFRVKFHDGVLEMTTVPLKALLMTMLQNFIALEMLYVETDPRFSPLCTFIGFLVTTSDDVGVLRRCSIIDCDIANDEEVALLISQLSKGIFGNRSKPAYDLHRRLNKYCDKKWHKWQTSFIREYCSSPWKTIALVAAVTLLVLTFLQSYMALHSYFLPPRSRIHNANMA